MTPAPTIDRALQGAGPDPVRAKRPKFADSPRTQTYWYAKLQDAYTRLEMENRAHTASRNRRRYGKYQRREGQSNAISRKLVIKVRNTVQETPVLTPHFAEADDELHWADRLRSFAADQAHKTGLKRELRRLCWDNYFAGVAWAQVDFQSRFSAGTPVQASMEKRQAAADRDRIELEFQQAMIGQMPMLSPDDPHSLDIEIHERHRDDLMALRAGYPAGTFEAQQLDLGLQLMDVHIADHRYAENRVEDQKVRFRRVPPFSVVYDPDALCWEDSEWYAVDMTERKEVLEANPDLKHVRDLKGSAGCVKDPYFERQKTIDAGPVSGTGPEAPTELWVRYWLIHDRLEELLIVIAEPEIGEQRPLHVGPWPYPGPIVRPVVLRPVQDEIAGVSECEVLETLHDQLQGVQNKIQQYIDAVPAFKFLIQESLASHGPFKRSLKDPKIPYAVTKGDPSQGIKEFRWPGIDKELLEREQVLNAALDWESGIPDYAQMGSNDETATLTSAKDRQMGTQLGSDKEEIADVVEWWLANLINIWRESGTVEQWVRIVGDSGRDWQQFLPQDLPHNITWLVDADSLAPTKRELEKKQALEFVAAITPFAIPEPLIQMRPILAALIRKFDLGPEDLSEIFVQPMLPVAEPMPGEMPPEAGAGPTDPNQGLGLDGQQQGAQLAPMGMA